LERRPDASVVVESAGPLGRADQRALSVDLLREQFGRLGGTVYELAGVDADIQGRPFAPASVLNQMRREAVERLGALQAAPPKQVLKDPDAVLDSIFCGAEAPRKLELAPQLHLLVRTPEQLEAAIEFQPASITLDYLDLYGLKPSVDRVKQSGISVRIASPRVLKPGEERVLEFLLRLDCPILARSAGILTALEGTPHPPLTGDFSLNAANAVTADMLLRMGMERLAPTYDLNAAQVATLAGEVGAERIEAVAYQHLPVFHTEHCVFCRFLSTGTTYKDCGRPCESHRVSVRDVTGRAHPVMADVGCRNTMFGAEAQDASPHLDAWREAGIVHYRLEFVHETAEETLRISRAFAAHFEGRKTRPQLTQELKRIAPQGSTEGSLFVPSNYLTLPVLQ
jgi:putative protease